MASSNRFAQLGTRHDDDNASDDGPENFFLRSSKVEGHETGHRQTQERFTTSNQDLQPVHSMSLVQNEGASDRKHASHRVSAPGRGAAPTRATASTRGSNTSNRVIASNRGDNVGRGSPAQRGYYGNRNGFSSRGGTSSVLKVPEEPFKGGPARRSTQPSRGPVNVFGDQASIAKGNFPRVSPLNTSINTDKADRALQSLAVDQTIHYLRQRPDDEDEIMGVFLWPADEDSGVEPMRAEDPKLDEIRKKHSCHLVLEQNPRRLCIWSADSEVSEAAVSAALQAIRTLIEESLNRSVRCVRFIIADPPLDSTGTPSIRMVPLLTKGIASSRAAGASKARGAVAKAESPILQFEDDWAAHVAQIKKKNVLTLEMALARSLECLVVSPGRVEIKALMGCFIFNRMANAPRGQEVTPISKFYERLRDTKSQGLLLRLSPEARLFARVLAKDDLFEAFVGGKLCPLETIRPTYTGVFTFPARARQDTIDRQLSIELGSMPDEDGNLMVLRRDWTSPYEHQSSRQLEVYVANLQGQLSWKLEAIAQPYCRNIEDELQRFQARVEALRASDASVQPGSTELMFKFPALPRKKDFYQRTQWKFYAKTNSNYVFLLSRLDRFVLIEKPGLTAANLRRPVATEWEASIHDERWDEMLGQNAALSLAERASWDPSIARFFPSEDGSTQGSRKGFADFVDCVTNVCHGLSNAMRAQREFRKDAVDSHGGDGPKVV